jgi:hypothetical protein
MTAADLIAALHAQTAADARACLAEQLARQEEW